MRLIAAILVLIGMLATPAAAEKRVALVIGNGAYGSVPALENPRADAEEMAAALQRLGFEVELGVDLDLEAMRRTVQAFARRLEGADVALFFYAGHGMQVYGQNYLLPVDAVLKTEADLDFAAFPARLVTAQMERWPAVKIIMLDACRDNPFASELSRSMGATRAARALSRGLAPIETAGGTLLAYATDPGDVASDGEGRHSPFTQALLEHIEAPGVEVNTMLARVRAEVYRSTRRQQRPWTETSLIGEFYLNPEPVEAPVQEAMLAPERPVPAPAPAPQSGFDARALELALWEAVQAGGGADDYEEYLRQYPEGVFAGVAKNRMEALRRAEGAGAAEPVTGEAMEADDGAAEVAAETVPEQGETAAADGDVGAADDAENVTAVVSSADGAQAVPADDPAATEPDPATAGPESEDGGGQVLAALPGSTSRASAMGNPEAQEEALGLGREVRREVQARLMLAGHDPRGIDGVFGPGTRAAVAAWQAAAGLEPTGYLNPAALARLRDKTESAYAMWVEQRQREAEAARAAAERTRTARQEPAAPIDEVGSWPEPEPLVATPAPQEVRAEEPSASAEAEDPRARYAEECYFVFSGSVHLERRCEKVPAPITRLKRRW